MPNVEIDGTNSTVKTDVLTSQSGTAITVPTGKVLTVTDAAGLTVAGTAPLTSKATVEALDIELPAANLTGSIDAARVPVGAVTQHVPPVDLTAVRQDIAMLALYSASADNKAAYNLGNAFIDHFQDSTGVTTVTDVTNVDEYFTSVSGGGDDTYTKLLCHFEDTALANTASSATVNPSSVGGGCSRSSTAKKFGTYSMRNTGTTGIHFAYDSAWMAWAAQSVTIDYWYRLDNVSVASPGQSLFSGDTDSQYMAMRHHNPQRNYPQAYNSGAQWGSAETGSITGYVNNTWYHAAMVHDAADRSIKGYNNGFLDIQMYTSGSVLTGSALSIFGDWGGGNTWYPTGYLDEFRISVGIARWTTSVALGVQAFVPPTEAYSPLTVSATGTLVSDTQTVPSAITKMSGVILIKEGGSSTTVMGNHLTISFSATNGTGNDWVNVPTYTAVTAPFSTGITMIKLSETTVPSGTSPTIRAKWAGQTSGGFESQLHGWAMNY